MFPYHAPGISGTSPPPPPGTEDGGKEKLRSTVIDGRGGIDKVE